MTKYSYRSKRKLCYTSPTSGKVRCGNPLIHFDEDKNKEFVMVRAVGGGTKRLYNWRRRFKPV